MTVELTCLGSSFHHLGWEIASSICGDPVLVKPEGLPSERRVSSDAASDAGKTRRGRWGMYRRTGAGMDCSMEGVRLLSVPGSLAEIILANDDNTAGAHCRSKKQGWPRSCDRQ